VGGCEYSRAVNRRQVLGALGIASGQAMLWAFGCGSASRSPRAPAIETGELRGWLHDAVASLTRAGFASPHALAVRHQRTTAAVDVLGQAVANAHHEGVVLTVRDRNGACREHATGDVSAAGVAAAVRALSTSTGGGPRGTGIAPRRWSDGADPPSDDALVTRLLPLARRAAPSSRVIYQAATLDLDDTRTWSVAADHDLEQRVVRIQLAATRVAWAGTRPIAGEVARMWTGALDDHELGDDELDAAGAAALLLTTPGTFEDGTYAVALDPSVVAALIDAATGALLTSDAARRPDVARRLALGANVASPVLALVDDPTVPGAYGGFHFDDEGAVAAPIALVTEGAVVGRIADRAGVLAGLANAGGRGTRPGNLGPVSPMASHLTLASGDHAASELLADGFVLEAARGASVDPATDRFVVAIARAREVRGGVPTGRVYSDLELVGELAALLASVSAASRETRSIGIREPVGDYARWRSIEAPWLLARGNVHARRSDA
jgi:predicted Zn-dependent protease